MSMILHWKSTQNIVTINIAYKRIQKLKTVFSENLSQNEFENQFINNILQANKQYLLNLP